MSEKFFIFTLGKDNELFKFIDDDQKNSFENKHFIKIDDHVLFIHSLDLDSEIKHLKLRGDLEGEITNATSCYVSLHRGSKENVKNSQRQIFPQDKTIFIEEHHNSGFIYEKMIEYVKAEKDDEKEKIRNDIKEYFELNETIRENWKKLNGDLKNYIIENNAKINPSSKFIFVLAELSPDLFGENFNEEEWTKKNPAEFYGVELICESNLLDHHKHIILLSTVKQEIIEKFNIKANNEFLKIPIIHLFNINKNTTIKDIENFGNEKSSEIPFPSDLFIEDMKETFCKENGLLDEIIHPLYRELTQEEEEKIYQGIIRNFSLDDKEKEELRKFINERKKESIRELVLRKEQKGKPEKVIDDDTYIKDQKIVVIEDEKQVAEKIIKGKSIERGFKDENFLIITTYEEYEDFIRQPIITESIFIIDCRLKWWLLQGYDIIRQISERKPSAYFFFLSGKNKSILLKLDPKIGARVQIFSKDDVLNNEAEFNLFARTIYNKIVEISFINRIIKEDPNIKNLTEKKKQEKAQQLKNLLGTANFTSIIKYVSENLKNVIESLEKNETPSFEVPRGTWGADWNENKIKVRLFAMCYYDYLKYKKPKNSYENLFAEVKKILNSRNEKMINNKLILKEEVFENWDLMLPIETKIRKILLFYYTLKNSKYLFKELFGGKNKDIEIILKNFEWLKSLFPELTEEAKTFLNNNLSSILENHAFKIIEEDLETLQGELNKFGEILDDPEEIEEKWKNLFQNETFLKNLFRKGKRNIVKLCEEIIKILPEINYLKLFEIALKCCPDAYLELASEFNDRWEVRSILDKAAKKIVKPKSHSIQKQLAYPQNENQQHEKEPTDENPEPTWGLDLEFFKNELDKEERQVYDLILSGEQKGEICKKLKINSEEYQRIINSIREKYNKFFRE